MIRTVLRGTARPSRASQSPEAVSLTTSWEISLSKGHSTYGPMNLTFTSAKGMHREQKGKLTSKVTNHREATAESIVGRGIVHHISVLPFCMQRNQWALHKLIVLTINLRLESVSFGQCLKEDLPNSVLQ